MTDQNDSNLRREALGLVVLRLGLAWFLFVWAVNKFLAPAQYQKIWGYFHGIEIGATMPYVMGGGQIIICLFMVLGFWRSLTYGVAFVMHGVTTIVISSSLIAPFVIENGYPTNRNASITIAALAAFAALWLLRHRDHWSLDQWLKQRQKPGNNNF